MAVYKINFIFFIAISISYNIRPLSNASSFRRGWHGVSPCTAPSSQITIDLYGRFQSYFLLAVDFTAKRRDVHGVSKQTYSEKGAVVTTAAVYGETLCTAQKRYV